MTSGLWWLLIGLTIFLAIGFAGIVTILLIAIGDWRYGRRWDYNGHRTILAAGTIRRTLIVLLLFCCLLFSFGWRVLLGRPLGRATAVALTILLVVSLNAYPLGEAYERRQIRRYFKRD